MNNFIASIKMNHAIITLIIFFAFILRYFQLNIGLALFVFLGRTTHRQQRASDTKNGGLQPPFF